MEGSALVIITFLGLLATVASSAKNGTTICQPAPTWSIEDEVPMNRTLGQVTVLALLQASCKFCLTQAANMGPLRDKMAAMGLTNIKYLILNDQSFMSRLLYPELKRRAPPGVPVYQQVPAQKEIWDILDGAKDDFLIYDRCGRLTFHIRLPLSYLHFPYVEAAIRYTYLNDACGNCSFYPNSTLISMNETTVPPTNSSSNVTNAPISNEEKSSRKETNHNRPEHHQHHEEDRKNDERTTKEEERTKKEDRTKKAHTTNEESRRHNPNRGDYEMIRAQGSGHHQHH